VLVASKSETNIKFMRCQVKKIDIDKWYEGLRLNRDPSSDYINDWVEKNAKKYREEWFKSACVTCPQWEKCGWKAVEQCHEGEVIMNNIMTTIFKKQYNNYTIGGHESGCEKNTIHYFLATVEENNVILSVQAENGNKVKELIDDVIENYKCISIVLGIPFLISKDEENTAIIKKYIEDNEWI
jgi:hypothetical protein